MFKTTHAVANRLGYKAQTLTYLEKIRSTLYATYTIPKHNGKRREINTYLYKSKDADLHPANKVEESRFLAEVHEKINRNIFASLETPDYVMGFKPGISVIDVAKKHVRKEWVAVLDIKDFFPSVRSNTLMEVLQNRYGFGEMAAWLIARLVCFRDRLPQGAKTSPMASNIAFVPVDEQIYELAKIYGFTYTRYADDLIFSAKEKYTKEEVYEFLDKVKETVQKNGFKVNIDKTKVYHRTQRQYVLGILVNKKTNLPKDHKHLLRAMIHNFVVKNRIPFGEDPVRYKRRLLGKVNYLLSINKLEQFEKLKRILSEFKPETVKRWQYLVGKTVAKI